MEYPKWVKDNFDEEQLEKGQVFIKARKSLKRNYDYYYMPSFERFCTWIEDKYNIESMEFFQK